jgi:formimidoylglutamate deiminase
MSAHNKLSMGFPVQPIWAEQALVEGNWLTDVLVEVGRDGRIQYVSSGQDPSALPAVIRVGALLPSPTNLHSHAFQRAMAGMAERRGPSGMDTFWTWRELMFRFLEALTPDDIEAIAAFVQMEMLEAGYCAVAEFHYVHHQPGGAPYDDPAEMSARICAAASRSGIGLTLLPVLYQQGGCDGRPLASGQVRFGNTVDRYAGLVERVRSMAKGQRRDFRTSVAPHSLRAVTPEGLAASVALAGDGPIHMHLAEQMAEVDEVQTAYGRRPVEWLFDHHAVNEHWCLIHNTQMTGDETAMLARSGAVAGLCPITESSLGDGIFNGAEYLAHGGRFGIGSDSNIRISLSEELRTLEYSQRLRDRRRAVLASGSASTGRALLDGAIVGGAQAAGRDSGRIAKGAWADLMALDMTAVDLEGRSGDDLLDSFVFAGDDRMVCDVWSAGHHVVQGGRHVGKDEIEAAYRRTIRSLRERI